MLSNSCSYSFYCWEFFQLFIDDEANDDSCSGFCFGGLGYFIRYFNQRFTNFKYDKKFKNWILTKNELTVYSEQFEKSLKLDKEYGLQIRLHELKTQKNFGIVEFENFENK